jgi:hypothetical protein
MNKYPLAQKRYEKDLQIYNLVQAGIAAEGRGDFNVAIQSYEQAAKIGSDYAIGRLGHILDNVVTPPEHGRAVYWYKLGVRRGDSSFAWDLAMHYSSLGLWRWYRHWLHVAQRMGEDDASKELQNKYWWNKHNPELAKGSNSGTDTE